MFGSSLTDKSEGRGVGSFSPLQLGLKISYLGSSYQTGSKDQSDASLEGRLLVGTRGVLVGKPFAMETPLV